jgi:hypothetical protein
MNGHGSIRMGKALLASAGLIVAALSGLGCAIHTQAPIKEVAYDFSDYYFYDRAYAPSPQYAQSYEEYNEPVRPRLTSTSYADSRGTASMADKAATVAAEASAPDSAIGAETAELEKLPEQAVAKATLQRFVRLPE